ncbi:unnamed protein product, partial [Prorocentrum cordatum]
MEVQSNLLAEDRSRMLRYFEGPEFKKVALVVVGEPPAAYKAKVQEMLLKDKRIRRGSGPMWPRTPRTARRRTGAEEGAAKAEVAVELSAEEKKLWFRKGEADDLHKRDDLGQHFSSFSIPTKDRGGLRRGKVRLAERGGLRRVPEELDHRAEAADASGGPEPRPVVQGDP